MVGSRSEQGGIIKDGAKMVNAVANSVVPKITIVMGNSYGAGNYAMCGKAFDPRFIFAWPTAKIAVMGGSQAAKTLLQIQKANIEKNKGDKLTTEEENALLKNITDKYEKTTTPYYAAARIWVDEIIDPAKTRDYISMSLASANQAPITRAFNPEYCKRNAARNSHTTGYIGRTERAYGMVLVGRFYQKPVAVSYYTLNDIHGLDSLLKPAPYDSTSDSVAISSGEPSTVHPSSNSNRSTNR